MKGYYNILQKIDSQSVMDSQITIHKENISNLHLQIEIDHDIIVTY